MSPNILRTEARMFVMTRQEAQYDLGVISGSLPICSMDAYVLIDLGSMHSYISFMFSQHINRMVDLSLHELLKKNVRFEWLEEC